MLLAASAGAQPPSWSVGYASEAELVAGPVLKGPPSTFPDQPERPGAWFIDDEGGAARVTMPAAGAERYVVSAERAIACSRKAMLTPARQAAIGAERVPPQAAQTFATMCRTLERSTPLVVTRFEAFDDFVVAGRPRSDLARVVHSVDIGPSMKPLRSQYFVDRRDITPAR